MQLTIAVIVTTKRVEGQTKFFVQTLGDQPSVASDSLLKTAIQRLASEARKRLQTWVDRGRSSEIAEWLYEPDSDYKVFKETLTLRDRTLTLKTILCLQKKLDGTIVFAPLLHGLRYQRDPKLPFQTQASDVLSDWCNSLIKADSEIHFDGFVLQGEAWVEPLDIVLTMGATKKKKKPGMIGALLGQSNPGGSAELQRVGRCLDSYHQTRSELFGRDVEASRLHQLLSSERRQSVLLLGPDAVGKTAILEDVVRRRATSRGLNRRHRQQVWLISPGRVISGMSYLGQWEERWLSILKETYRMDHVLYFDDPIGLYTAGITRDSQLCMADVLKAFVSEHPIRLVFEMPHHALSILRRRDRSLVDPMVPLFVDAMDEQATLRTLIEVTSRIEANTNRFFHPGLLQKMIEYSTTLSPHQSLPGKAIAIAQGLAKQSKSRQPKIAEELEFGSLGCDSSGSITGETLDRFIVQRTGLRLELRQRAISLSDLRTRLSKMIFGQPSAVDVIARYALRSIKGLQSNDRPLGVFLFVGPTGVGKTESAKALTRVLFHDESRMIRIDMNEISSIHAAEQLIGTIEQPDGRLPSALRRQPNCVLLLDEIEKAHPIVLDYLLQVLGEGRLSDARGRLVDFRNAFIIMTSNLGSTESSQALGYDVDLQNRGISDIQAAADLHREGIFRRAVLRFFRPEFVNRLDELVLFERLNRSDMKGIVDNHLESLRQREGLIRRQIFLQVDDEATQWIVDRGYDAALGARAVKRAVEREVAQPLADQMAATQLQTPVWTHLRTVDQRLYCETKDLCVLPIGRLLADLPLDECLSLARARLDRLCESLLIRSPSGVRVIASSEEFALRPLSQFDYYAIHNAIGDAETFFKECRQSQRDMLEPKINPMQSHIKSTPSKQIANSHRIEVFNSARKDRIVDLIFKEALGSGSDEHDKIGIRDVRSRRMSRLVSQAELMLRHIDDPKRWIFRASFLNPPKASDHLDSISNRNGFLRSLDVFANQITAWCSKMFTTLGYAVGTTHDRSFAVIEGASVAGLIRPLLGTYQVAGALNMERLLLIEAKPIAGEFSIDDLDMEKEKFLSPKDREFCERELESMRCGTTREPIDACCGVEPWTTIRGEFSDTWLDYRTGESVPLKFSARWNDWLLDQCAYATEKN